MLKYYRQLVDVRLLVSARLKIKKLLDRKEELKLRNVSVDKQRVACKSIIKALTYHPRGVFINTLYIVI